MSLVKFNGPRPYTYQIPAGETSGRIQITGRFIYPKEANYSNFDIKFDNGDWVPSDLAFGFKVPAYMEPFKEIQIRNNSAETLIITLIIGEVDVIDRRVNLIESRNGSAASMIPNAINLIGTTAGTNTPFQIPASQSRALLLIQSTEPDSAHSFSLYTASAGDLIGTYSQMPVGSAANAGGPVQLKIKAEVWLTDGGNSFQIWEWCFS